MVRLYDKLCEIFSQRRFKKVTLDFSKNMIIDVFSLNASFNLGSKDIDYDEFVEKYGDYLFRKWKTLSARRYKQHCIKVLQNALQLSILNLQIIDVKPLDAPTGKIFYLKPIYTKDYNNDQISRFNRTTYFNRI